VERSECRVRFGELHSRGDWDQRRTVIRRWQHPDWPFQEYAAHRENWSSYRRRWFNTNGDGELDREERVSAAHFDRVNFDNELEGDKREVRFYVVERTITVSMP